MESAMIFPVCGPDPKRTHFQSSSPTEFQYLDTAAAALKAIAAISRRGVSQRKVHQGNQSLKRNICVRSGTILQTLIYLIEALIKCCDSFCVWQRQVKHILFK